MDLKAKLEGECSAMMGILLLNLGMETGLWKKMRGGASCNTTQLAQSTGLSERYLEELLRAATLHGYIQYCSGERSSNSSKPWDSGVPRSDTDTFHLSKEMEEVLFDEESPSYYGPSITLPLHFAGAPFQSLVKAFHDDTGVPYSMYADGKIGDYVEEMHRHMYLTETKSWMSKPELADIKTKLAKGGVVLDLGCGSASSSIAMAKEFVHTTVHAVDLDQASIDKAKINIGDAESKGLITPGQVIPHCCFAHEANISPGTVDLVLIFVSLHDMYNPSQVLSSTAPMLTQDGTILVLEFSAPDSFSSLMEEGVDPLQRGISQFTYSASVLHCLPVSKVENPSQAIGTVFSKTTMKVVASKAGFTRVESVKANEKMTLYIIKK